MQPKQAIRRILLIDDDEDEYLILKDAVFMIEPDVTVQYVTECSEDTIGESDPDLILLDINMPKKDGYACLKEIRNGHFKNLPVIMYSTSDSQQSIKKAYETGADFFITKPASFQVYLSAIRDLLCMRWRECASIVAASTSLSIL
jgi:DNA-binding response OmpR family regulator